ncbi:MAG: L,D-transpeptidase family protein [Atopobiaceae bacterium]
MAQIMEEETQKLSGAKAPAHMAPVRKHDAEPLAQHVADTPESTPEDEDATRVLEPETRVLPHVEPMREVEPEFAPALDSQPDTVPDPASDPALEATKVVASVDLPDFQERDANNFDVLAGDKDGAFAHPQISQAHQPKRTSAAAEKSTGSRKHTGLIAASAIIAGLGVIYLGGAIWFGRHFMPNTTVNGADVSGMSLQELAETVADDGSSYSLTVSNDDFSATFSGQDFSLVADGSSYAAGAISQINSWLWPAEILASHTLTVQPSNTFDQDQLTDLVQTAVEQYNSGAVQPTNAALSFDADAGTFSISPDSTGTALDADAVLAEVEAAVDSNESTLTLNQDALLKPTLTADSDTLAQSLDQANNIVAGSLELTVADTSAAELTSAELANWISNDDTGALALDEDAIKNWVATTLAQTVNSRGTTRTYTRPDGKSVTVTPDTKGDTFIADAYGWNVNTDATATALIAQLKGDNPLSSLAIQTTSDASSFNPGGQDWGRRYIDVDTTEQHARMYDESGSLIWESDIVTGDITEDNPTREGVWVMNSNRGTDQTLKGLDENHDGEPDYESHVTYWMPFIQNLYAFHDATWRSNFGGTIYQGAGSHGCINLPYDKAEELYNLCKVGDVVVVHS